MKIVNVDFITEKELEVMELVQASASESTIEQACQVALANLQKAAEKIGADAIIRTKLNHCMIEGKVTLLAYGTAVKYRDCYEFQQF